jgi:hypothetical protein
VALAQCSEKSPADDGSGRQSCTVVRKQKQIMTVQTSAHFAVVGVIDPPRKSLETSDTPAPSWRKLVTRLSTLLDPEPSTARTPRHYRHAAVAKKQTSTVDAFQQTACQQLFDHEALHI